MRCDLLTPQQFAELVRKGTRAVYALIAAGELVAEDHRSPGSTRPMYRIPRSELARWRQSRRTRGNRPVTVRTPTTTAMVPELFL